MTKTPCDCLKDGQCGLLGGNCTEGCQLYRHCINLYPEIRQEGSTEADALLRTFLVAIEAAA